ncbi:hypothetical protein MPER_11548, partial [Moniliophthora perniciosa FA553]
LLTSIPGLYTSIYRESIGIAGLHYLALGLGLYAGAQIANYLLDRIHARLKARHAIMFPATMFVPIGLLITGWTARSDIHWIAPDIGLVVTGIGMAINWQAIQTYIFDTYTLRAAPGYGVGDTVLAACAFGLGFPTILVLWFFGKNLRARSQSALKD